MQPPVINTPWMTAADAAQYLKRSKQFVHREVRAGRLCAARVGGRREVMTKAEWCDAWVHDQTAPVVIPARWRA